LPGDGRVSLGLGGLRAPFGNVRLLT
jgi:hypothetical protein